MSSFLALIRRQRRLIQQNQQQQHFRSLSFFHNYEQKDDLKESIRLFSTNNNNNNKNSNIQQNQQNGRGGLYPSYSSSSAALLLHSKISPRIHYFSTTAAAAATTETTIDDDDDNDDSSLSLPYTLTRRKGMRCLAIVAHVDHGKTSLVDCLLRASTSSSKSNNPNNKDGNDNSNDPTIITERLLDSGDLEKERGITITSKVTRVHYDYNNENENNNNNNNNSTTTTTPDMKNINNNTNTNIIINIADTPGHADFSAEVDRILSVTDGFLLVVDVVEGPKSQTKYVLTRALAAKLNPIVVLNKCDRPEAISKIDSGETENQILDLFIALNATDDQLEYTTLYASARQGWITKDPIQAMELATMTSTSTSTTIPDDCQMSVLLDTIVQEIPEPLVRLYNNNNNNNDNADKTTTKLSPSNHDFEKDKFSLAAVSVGYDPFLGRTCSGRITSGSIGINDRVLVLPRSMLSLNDEDDNNNNNNKDPKQQQQSSSQPSFPTNITGVFVYKGTQRVSLQDDYNANQMTTSSSSSSSSSSSVRALAGDYVTIAGVPDSIAVGDTVTSSANPVPQPIETLPLAPPTLSMDFGANDGPFMGKEGTIIASSQVRDRLLQETDNNVTLKVTSHPNESEKTIVYARGELQLGILVEQMRREGYEMVISPPKILTKKCPETGVTLEPYEEVVIDVDSEYTGAVVNIMTSSNNRKATLLEMKTTDSDGKSQLIFEMPSRGMLGGFRSELATATRGSAVINHIFIGDRELQQGGSSTTLDQQQQTKAKLVSTETGKASAYALASIEARGTLFIGPGEEVYPGMVIGELSKGGGGSSIDLEVNPVRSKEKTNMRTQAKDEKIQLVPPKRMSVEELIAYMDFDEMIEVTPKSVRLRKQLLDSGERERAARTKAKQLRALKEQQQQQQQQQQQRK